MLGAYKEIAQKNNDRERVNTNIIRDKVDQVEIRKNRFQWPEKEKTGSKTWEK